MTIHLDGIIRENTETEFNEFVYKLIDLYSLEEVCSHIYKSKFINIVLLEKLYHSIVNSDSINTNLVLNNLFIKVVSHNIAKEIPEKDIIHIIKDINIDLFENHSCELNYHNFKESTCMFSIYKSFKMCLFYYLNDTYNSYINNNGYISEYFVRKYLKRSTYQSFKDNRITLPYNTHYLEESINDSDRYINLNSLLILNNTSKQVSINNSLLWDQINHDYKENIDMNYIFLNNFRKQELIIKANSIAYWGAISKLYNWLSWCYWNPESPFRKKKLAAEWELYKRHCNEYTNL